MINFKCWKCGEMMEAPISLVGDKLECPNCRSVVAVPEDKKLSNTPCQQVDNMIKAFDSATDKQIRKTNTLKYGVARVVCNLNIILGWLLVFIGIIFIIFSFAGIYTSIVAFLPGIYLLVIGLIEIMLSQVALAILDTASHSGEILRVIKRYVA